MVPVAPRRLSLQLPWIAVRVRGQVRGQVRGRSRLSYSFLVIHTSRALTGPPLAVPSRGPRGIHRLCQLPCVTVLQ